MKTRSLAFAAAMLLIFSGNAGAQRKTAVEDIHIRDPFILADESTHTYYMYRSSTAEESKAFGGRGGVSVFKSHDLKWWTGPENVMQLPEDNWVTGRIWAPEVHEYNGRYYLFATVNSDIVWQDSEDAWGARKTFRGVQIFSSDSPEGPFKPFSRFPHSPMDQMALDGTLCVEDGIPYMVYCHEWVQVADGAMNLVRLSDDLSATEGQPVTLFRASAAKWSTGSAHDAPLPKSYVTDGCFLYRTKTGKLLMIWSSFMYGQYALGIAESVTGSVRGPWKQNDEPLFSKDGGHGMIFKSFEGKLYLVLHCPNNVNERAKFIELEDTGETLVVKRER